MRPPVALMVYNRPNHTKKTLEALKNNLGATETKLFIFSDGPKNEEDAESVEQVRLIVREFGDAFGAVEIIESDLNRGLAESIINGVSMVLQKHGEVIVFEDDLVCSPQTLNYFKKNLDFYRNSEAIFSISAYSHPESDLKLAESYPNDVYFIPRMMCWGWATWNDRWIKTDWEVSDFRNFIRSNEMLSDYKYKIGEDSLRVLKKNVAGNKDVWACRWVYTHFKNNAFCVCPTKSYVRNIGFDGSGTNCGKISLGQHDLNNTDYESLNLPKNIQLDLDIFNSFMAIYRNRELKNKSKNKKKVSLKKKIKQVIKKPIKTVKKSLKLGLTEGLIKLLSININLEIIYLGTDYGGWDVIPKLIGSNDLVLSVGVGEDISFDVAIARIFHVNVVLMDPTPRAIKHFEETKELIYSGRKAPINHSQQTYKATTKDIKRLNYIPWGLWHKDCLLKFYSPQQETHVSHSINNLHKTETFFEADCKCLESVAAEVDLDRCSIMKLDIEGAEYSVIRSLIRFKSFRPKQLLVEFHPGASRLEQKYKVKTLLHIFLLRLTGYKIFSRRNWEFHFVYYKALN